MRRITCCLEHFEYKSKHMQKNFSGSVLFSTNGTCIITLNCKFCPLNMTMHS